MKPDLSRLLTQAVMVVCLLSATLLAGPPTALAQSEAMPELYYHPQFNYPYWVSVSQAVTSAGTVNRDVFREGLAEVLESGLRTPLPVEADCLDFGPHPRVRKPPETLGGALRGSDYVVLARVTGVASGFKGLTPMTLVRLSTDRVFRGSQTHGLELFLLLPAGEFMAGSVRVCMSAPRWASDLPRVGERVLVAVPSSSVTLSDELIQPPADGFFVLPEDGPVLLPSPFREQVPEIGVSSEAFLDLVATELEVDQ